MRTRAPAFIRQLVARSGAAHKRRVPDELFDMRLRAMRRDRAFRQGPELFLLERAFSDVLERLDVVRRRFGAALLVGCPDPSWPERLQRIAGTVDVVDPGPLFAQQVGGTCALEERLDVEPWSYDLCVAIGTLDTVNDLPAAFRRIRFALRENALLIGAMAGGDMLPRLRGAMRAADEQIGGATPHVHPRIEPAALTTLLSASGFVDAVVDVDRVQVAYSSLADLVRDLRAMAGTNLLNARSRSPLTRAAAAAAAARFAEQSDSPRVTERFELLHFAAWTPAQVAPAGRG